MREGSENASNLFEPVRLAPQGLKAVPRSVRFTSRPSFCKYSFMPGPNSTGRRNRHLHPSFVPKFNFIRCFERRDQFPFPVHSPSRPEGVCPLPLPLQHPACASFYTAGRSKTSRSRFRQP